MPRRKTKTCLACNRDAAPRCDFCEFCEPKPAAKHSEEIDETEDYLDRYHGSSDNPFLNRDDI